MGADPDQQSAWVARFIALSFSKGVERSFWYGWDSAPWGTLWDPYVKQIRKPGIAYREVSNWMTDANFSPCQLSGSIYQCQITRANGYKALMVWSPSSTVNFKAPADAVRLRTLDAQASPLSGGQTITVGMKPVLIENQ